MTRDWQQALQAGDLQVLEDLAIAGADVDARDAHGQTALMVAAHRGQTAIVRWLIAKRANLDHTAKFGLSALMLAALGGHADIVRALVDAGADKTRRGTGTSGFAQKTAADLARDEAIRRILQAADDGA